MARYFFWMMYMPNSGAGSSQPQRGSTAAVKQAPDGNETQGGVIRQKSPMGEELMGGVIRQKSPMGEELAGGVIRQGQEGSETQGGVIRQKAPVAAELTAGLSRPSIAWEKTAGVIRQRAQVPDKTVSFNLLESADFQFYVGSTPDGTAHLFTEAEAKTFETSGDLKRWAGNAPTVMTSIDIK